MTDRQLAAGSARGGSTVLFGQAIKMGLQFVALVVLSRLLSPEEFGLLAMVTAFTTLGELLRDFGTGIVGLQRRELSQQQASNLFWMSTLLGMIASTCLALATPLLVALYQEPRLAGVVPALAGSILLNSMAAQLQVRLSRSGRYASLTLADVTAMAFALIAAVAAALAGWGYWALVTQTLVLAASGLLLKSIAARWRPSLPRRDRANRSMVRDSGAFGTAQILNYFAQNLDTILIGSRFGATSVGEYSRAFQLLTLPLNALMTPLTQVVIPTVNRALRVGRSVDSVLLPLQFMLGFVLIGSFAIAAGTAEWLIPGLLGPDWSEVSPLFQILAIGGSVWALSRVSYWGFIARNLSTQLLLYNVVTKVLATALIVGGALISVDAVAWAASIGLILSWPVNLIWLSRCSDQDSSRYWWAGVRLLFAGASSAAAALWVGATVNPWIGGVSGLCVYLSVIACFPACRQELRAAFVVLKAVRPGREPGSASEGSLPT